MTVAVQNPQTLPSASHAAPTGEQVGPTDEAVARAALMNSLGSVSYRSGGATVGQSVDPAAQTTSTSSAPLTEAQLAEASKAVSELTALPATELDSTLSAASEAQIRQWVQGALGMLDLPDVADPVGLVVRLLSTPNAQGVVNDIFNVAKAAGGEREIPLIIEKAAQAGQPDLADQLLRYTMTAAVVWPDSILNASLTDVMAKQGQYGNYMANAIAAFGDRMPAGGYASFSDLWRAATAVRLGAPDKPHPNEFGALRTKGSLGTPVGGVYNYIAQRVMMAADASGIMRAGKMTLYQLEMRGEAGTAFSIMTRSENGKQAIVPGSAPPGGVGSWMFHPDAGTLLASFDKMDEIYKAAMAAPDQATFEKEAARLYWYVAQAAPDRRGSAAKAEIVYRALFEAKGFPPPDLWRPGVSADLEAMLRTEDQWLAEYKGLQARGADWVNEFKEISSGERTPVSIADKYQIDADGIARDIFGERVGTKVDETHVKLDADGSVVDLHGLAAEPMAANYRIGADGKAYDANGNPVGTRFDDAHIKLDAGGAVVDLNGAPGPSSLGDLGFYRGTDGKTILKADGTTFGTLASETAATDVGGYIVDDQGRKIGFLDKNGGLLACTDDGKFLGYRDGEGNLWSQPDTNGQRSRLGALNAEGGCDFIDPKTGQTVATVSRDGVAKGTDFLDRFRADLHADLEIGRAGAGVAVVGMLIGFGLMFVGKNEGLETAGLVMMVLDPLSWPLLFPMAIGAINDAQAHYEDRVRQAEAHCAEAYKIFQEYQFDLNFIYPEDRFYRWEVPDVKPLIDHIEQPKATAEKAGEAELVQKYQQQVFVLTGYPAAYASSEELLSSD